MASDIDILFTPRDIGSRSAPNRFVAQAMEASDGAHDGAVSERALARYLRLADGGWGVVFVEATSVTPASRGRLRGLLLTQATLTGFEALVAQFKARNPAALLMIQLTHSGRQTHASMDRVTVLPDSPPGVRYLDAEEIEDIKRQFVEAAILAERAGFDGVDIKLCHGYLGTELLRPANTRPDRWGGSFENRTRFVREVFEEIATRQPVAGFVLGSRVTFYERRPGGCGSSGPAIAAFDPVETFELIRLLSRHGAHYVNVSGGGLGGQCWTRAREEERLVGTLHYERLATALVREEALGLAVIGTGYSELGDSAVSVAAERLGSGDANLVGFGRQSFADALLPRKVREGLPIHFCKRRGSCAKLMLRQQNAGCVVHDPYYREQLRDTKNAARST